MRASPTDPEDAFLSRTPDLDCKTKNGQPSATGLKTRSRQGRVWRRKGDVRYSTHRTTSAGRFSLLTRSMLLPSMQASSTLPPRFFATPSRTPHARATSTTSFPKTRPSEPGAAEPSGLNIMGVRPAPSTLSGRGAPAEAEVDDLDDFQAVLNILTPDEGAFMSACWKPRDVLGAPADGTGRPAWVEAV